MNYSLSPTHYILSLVVLFLLSSNILHAQLEIEFEYEEPNPALEFSLNEYFPQNNYNLFSFPADSLYQILLNSSEPTELILSLDNEHSYTLVLNNYSIHSSLSQDSLSYSMQGYVDGYPTSSVAGLFSENYFWIQILIDSINIRIDPIRSINEQFVYLENSYIVASNIRAVEEININSENINNEDINIPDCNDFHIELGIFVDNDFVVAHNNDYAFIKLNIEAQILFLEKFYNDEIGGDPDPKFKFEIENKDYFLSKHETQGWNYTSVLDMNLSVNSRWVADYCRKPDIYILFTSRNLGGGHATPGICDALGYPGLALVSTSGHDWSTTPDEITYFNVQLAHEVTHVMGAGEGEANCSTECISNPNCTPANLMCQYQCSASAEVKMNLFQCSIAPVLSKLNAKCEDCLSTFETPECLHCFFSGDITSNDDHPFVVGCDSRNEFEITYTFKNNCDERSIHMEVAYNNVQLERISGLNEFISETSGGGDYLKLIGPVVSLPGEDKLEYTVRFKLRSTAYNNFIYTELLTSHRVYAGSGDGTQIYTFDNEDLTYFVPDEINGQIRISNLIGTGSQYLFQPQNIEDCSLVTPNFRVNGKLIIDEDYCLYNSHILMGSNSKIVIESGNTLTINSDNIVGCEEMWNGIIVESGGTLNLTGSNIQDAIKAIELQENATLTVSETEFINNNFGVYSNPESQADISINILAGNKFIAGETLMKEPFIGNKAKAGIWLKNVNEVLIQGEPPYIEPGMNIFGNLNNGIVLFNTDATINNFHIYNISSPAPTETLNNDLPNGHGIYINGSSGQFTTTIGSEETRDNYINGSLYGIYIRSSNAVINHCNILDAFSGITLGYNPRRTVTAKNNLIDSYYRGVQLRMPSGLTAEITANRFTSRTSNSIAIEGLSSWGRVKIDQNVIYLNESRDGISLTDCKLTHIHENDIIIQENTTGTMHGITLLSSQFCQIDNKNRIVGNSPEANTVGIYLQDSPSCSVQCNEIYNTNISSQFTGTNSFTNFKSNLFGESDYGLLLGSPAQGSDAIIGTQKHKENLWYDPSYGEKAASNLSSDIVIIGSSPFLIDYTQPQQTYLPSNLSELTLQGWFQHDEPISNYGFNCNEVEEPIEDYLPWYTLPCCDFQGVPNGTIDFETYSDVKNFYLQLNLIDWLLHYPDDTSASNSIHAFYSSIDTTGFYRYAKARKYFTDAMDGEIQQQSAKLTNGINEILQISDLQFSQNYLTIAAQMLKSYLDSGDLNFILESYEELKDIALLCPYQFGPAVYIARSLVRAVDMDIEFKETSLCGQVEPRSPENFNKGDLISNSYTVYPNPTRTGTVVSIEGENGIQSIQIFDIFGRLQWSNDISMKSKADIMFDFLDSGIYFLKVNSCIGTSEVYKVFLLE